MAKSVVGLNIKIGANVASLQRDLGRAAGSVRQFGANAGGAANGLGAMNRASVALSSGASRLTGFLRTQVGAFVAIAAASAAAAVSIRGLTDRFSEIDKIAKLSDTTGASTEALVALRKASSLAGVEASKFDVAFKKMVRSIGDAKAGTGEAKDALERMGLSVSELASASPEEAFAQIADAINKLGTQSEKAAAAAAIFGRAGVDLLPMLSIGRDGLDAMRAEVDRLGESFSRVDGAKVEAANDAITRMKDAFKGVTTELAIAFAPAVEKAAMAVAGMVAAFRNVKAGSIEAAAKIAAFVAGLTVALTIIPKIVAAIRTIIVTLRAMTTASAIAQAFGGPAGWVSLAASVAIAAGAVYGVGEAFDAMESSSSAAAGAVSDVSSAMDAIEEVSDAVDTATSAVDEYAEKWKGIGERIADSVTTPVEKIRQRIAEIREAFSGGFIDTETATRAIVAARDELDALGKERDAFSATPSIGAAVRGTSGGFSAVQEGQQTMKDLVAHAKKKEESDKRREKLLADMLEELELIAESTEKPLKVKEHDII